MSRWADVDSDPAAPVVPAGGTCELVRRRVYPLEGDGELLVQMYEASAPGAATTRRVVFTTDAADALVLHWGVSRDEPDQWILPSEAVWPRGTAPVSEISVETPLVPGEACLDADGECATVQTLTVDLPGAGADELSRVVKGFFHVCKLVKRLDRTEGDFLKEVAENEAPDEWSWQNPWTFLVPRW